MAAGVPCSVRTETAGACTAAADVTCAADRPAEAKRRLILAEPRAAAAAAAETASGLARLTSKQTLWEDLRRPCCRGTLTMLERNTNLESSWVSPAARATCWRTVCWTP